MAAIPYFPMFAADLLMDDDLFNLDPKAEGLVLRMWCLCWVDGYAPRDPEALSLKTRRPLSYIRKYLPDVLGFFLTDEKGNLWSERIETEREKAANKSDKCRSAINARWEKKRKGEATQESTDGHTDVSTDAIPSVSVSVSLKDSSPTPSGSGKPKREPKVQTLGGYCQELDQAMGAWRELRASLLSEEILCKFPNDPDGRYVAQVGTKGKAWEAWQKRRGKVTPEGVKVTDAHVLGAVKMWAGVKLRNATSGKTLSMPNLSSLINSADFEDALLRVAAPEVSHAS